MTVACEEYEEARILRIAERVGARHRDYRARREGHGPQTLMESARLVIQAMEGMIAKGRLMNEDLDLLDDGLSGLGFAYAEPLWPS